MTDRKVNRIRDKAVTIRMTPAEYDILQKHVAESGLTQQSFILSSIKDATVTSSEEIEVEKEISRILDDLVRQLRGMGTNINQMAHHANGQGVLPTLQELENLSSQVYDFRKESEKIWQLIRLSITQQNHTER